MFTLLGQSIATVFATALSIFIPSFMIRSLHATLSQVSGTWGFAVAAADLFGGLTGGWLADRLSKRDIRWYTWLPAITAGLAIPAYWIALTAQHLGSFVAADFVAKFIFSVGLPPVFCAIQAVCGGQRRAMAIAILQLCFYLIGMGLGPTITGVLSDAFGQLYGAESLRYSLMSVLMSLVPAVVAFYWAGRTIRADQEE